MGYIHEARQRAKKRLESFWTVPLLIFGFVLFLTFSFLLWYVVWQLHLIFNPEHTFQTISKMRAFGITIPLLFAAIPLFLLAANFIAYQISPVRKSLNKVANYKSAQKELWGFGKWIIIPCLSISILSAVL